MNPNPSPLGPVLFLISLAGGLVLVAMGTFFCLDHSGAAAAYGVSVSGGSENAWISSAALRDVAYGSLTLAFTLLRDRRAVGLCLLFGAIIPIGDAVVVLRASEAPLHYLPLHLGGAIVCVILAVVVLRSGSQKR